MEPTGFPTEFICDEFFPQLTRAFIQRQLERWPALLFDEERLDEEMISGWDFPDTTNATESEFITFCRDDEMNEFWDENGYATDSTGEGPFAVYFRRYADPLHAQRIEGVRQTRPDGREPLLLEGARLLLSTYYVVTLLTPDDPATDPFSRSVLNDFVRSSGSDL
ncbi:hypothetical protein ACWC9S_16050 [Streptomyces xiamenensis]